MRISGKTGRMTLCAALVWPLIAAAQGVLQRAATPYKEQPDIQFSVSVPGKPTVPAAVVSAPLAGAALPVTPPAPVYMLRTDEPIHTELAAWARAEGWELYWRHRASWRTLRETTIKKTDVTEAVAEVVDILREEGKPVTLRVSEGNKVMEILSTEVRND